eukprot:COSAG01_NODE_66336_length_270_cov_0.912281_1_plen_51_part_10
MAEARVEGRGGGSPLLCMPGKYRALLSRPSLVGLGPCPGVLFNFVTRTYTL